MTRGIRFSDVLDIAKKVPDLSGIVLVGGQALNFWSEQFGIAGTPETEVIYGAAVSDDIDFLGPARAARLFGEATTGKVSIAGMDDAHSPNTGLVKLELYGEERLIDFLDGMKGFSSSEIKTVKEWAAPVRIRHGDSTPLYVMHPIHCLQSQLENVYGKSLNRRAETGGERYASRVRLAIEACRLITLETLEKQGDRPALKIVEVAFNLAKLPSAHRARLEDQVLVEQSIPNSSPMPEYFLSKRLPQMLEQIGRASKRYSKQLST